MTTREFRQIRQMELIHFLRKNFGEGWRYRLNKVIPGKCANRRWFRADSRGDIHHKIEAWCYAHGFVSRYDELLEPVAHHVQLVQEVLSRSECGGLGHDPALPLRREDTEQLLFALGYK